VVVVRGLRQPASALAGGVPPFSLTIPSLTDPFLAPPGQHIVIVMALASDASSDAGLAERILSLAKRLLPGLRDHISAVVPVGPAAQRELAWRHIGSI